jgi:predicted homoserine dehydrogenase-like protein
VTAVAKRDLEPGDVLDGEGGYCAYGALVSAARASENRLLPIGLSAGGVVARPIAAGEEILLDQVRLAGDDVLLALRAESVADP